MDDSTATKLSKQVAAGVAEALNIRTLRGGRSRAAFARELGVTPLTVYRWELPESADEARRPRGKILARLQAFAAGLSPAQTPVPLPAVRALPVEIGRAEYERLLPVLERITQGEFRRAETDLLQLLASGELKTRGARAMASQGLARIYVLARGDGRGAFSMLAPILADLDNAALPPEVELAVHVAAALVFCSPDGRLFDAGKTTVHTSRAERLLDAHGSAEDRLLLWMAHFAVAFILNDTQLSERVLSRGQDVLHGHQSPLLHAIALFATSVAAFLSGRTALAVRRLEELVELTEHHQLSLFLARALSHLADATLDEAGDPRQVLALTERARRIAQEERHATSVHSLMCSWSEGEALLRMARFSEAETTLQNAMQQTEELGWTPIAGAMSLCRLYMLTGRSHELRALGERCLAYERSVQRSITHAAGAVFRALAGVVEGADPASLLEAMARADRAAYEGAGWGFLSRGLLLWHLSLRVLAEDIAPAGHALGRLERLLDLAPSASASAHLRQCKGILLLRQGRLQESKQVLEAALGTYELAGLLPEAALTRRTLANISLQLDEPEAKRKLEQSDAELSRLRIVLLPPVHPDRLRAPTTSASEKRPTGQGVERLVVPMQRLSVRGMTPALIQRELCAVLEELMPGCCVRLQEVDSQGQTLLVQQAGPPLASPEVSAEFGDGSGRRLRISVAGNLTEDANHLLAALTSVAALSLEVAGLRGFSEQRSLSGGGDQNPPELPGFVAASPGMRALKLDLLRLSRSRSIVIVTGESGTGKEIVARAIHDLSARGNQPFVAFNCAAVPRDLFEGQLFGYRKGAYTGASADHPGVIRSARGGTLFLDEVGELPLDVQPKLLRFLENGEIFPLGERRAVQVDVRVVAATHRDLDALVRQGLFREDLFYRLQVVPVHIPPLRERREDVIALGRHFLRQLTSPDREPPVLSPSAVSRLLAHDWPGNVRELRNVIERSLAFEPVPNVLDGEHLRIDRGARLG